MKQYKIGEFSKCLGVTPDFIKYYERFDLIFPNINEGKVKTYDFNNASKVIECMRLKNQGLSVKEIRQHGMEKSFRRLNEKLGEKMEEMKKRIEFETACINNYEKMQSWIQMHEDEKNSWTVFVLPEKVFLKHTCFDEFIMDDQVHEAMESWTKWLPVVHSCRYVQLEDRHVQNLNWGFMVDADFLKEHNLVLNGSCKTVKSQKVFCYSCCDDEIKGLEADLEKAFKILDQLNLEITGEIFEEIFAYTNTAENPKKNCEFYFLLK